MVVSTTQTINSLKLNKNMTTTATADMGLDQSCTNPSCFFCTMEESDPSLRSTEIATFFKEMPLTDNQEHVLVLSGLWNIAMTQPDDPEFPSLGIFSCMASLIQRGINDTAWLLKDQNIYIPYYAAHVIGSYTMNKAEFAEKAVESGVIPPLMELLRGKMSWVEQRVAVRALGHLASYERTFESVAEHEEEVVNSAMQLASTCLEEVYTKFVVGVEDRLKYHGDLLTRGVGGAEMEKRKAEEWASQLQCWSLYLLNCFACKERSVNLICRQDFLKDLGGMWGGLVNHSSPAGVGLIRILCHSKHGRNSISECKQVLRNLCNLARSSDDWQYMGIDCILLLLKDQQTRYKVLENVSHFLVDLVELKHLGDRSNVGEAITRGLLSDYKKTKWKLKNNGEFQSLLRGLWEMKVGRRKREKTMSDEKMEERKVLVGLIKQEANHRVKVGDIEEAMVKYSEALDICPLKLRKERMILYSNRAQCHLLVRDPDSAISDSTRALCLSSPVNSHGKSLWRRSQAYDMKGLGKESLMDCIMFLHGCVKVPYYAARMISKQVDATWIFAGARSRTLTDGGGDFGKEDGGGNYEEMMRVMMEKKGFFSGLGTILEEPLIDKEDGSKRKLQKSRRRRKAAMVGSM